jgi:hypothetical protein
VLGLTGSGENIAAELTVAVAVLVMASSPLRFPSHYKTREIESKKIMKMKTLIFAALRLMDDVG